MDSNTHCVERRGQHSYDSQLCAARLFLLNCVCVYSLNPDDSSKGLTLQGPLGGLVRRAAYLYRQPTDRHRFKVGRDWVQSALDNAQTMLSGSRQARY